MCYQLIERYNLCRCLYYQHAVDKCALNGRLGHNVISRTICVGMACAQHGSAQSTSIPTLVPSPVVYAAAAGADDEELPHFGPALQALSLDRFTSKGPVPRDGGCQRTWLGASLSGAVDCPSVTTARSLVPEDSDNPDLFSDLFHEEFPPPSLAKAATSESTVMSTSPVPSVFSASEPTSLAGSDASSVSSRSDNDDTSEAGFQDINDVGSEASEVETIATDGLSAEVRRQAVSSILNAYHAQSRQHGSSSTSGSSRSYDASPSESTAPSNGSRKRGRQEKGDADSDLDSPADTTTRKRPRDSPEKPLPFACIFFKKDSIRYEACGRNGLKRIRDVKQHLRRKHFAPFYCSRCWATFQSEQQRDSHVRVLDCELQPVRERNELCLEQITTLNKKVNAKLGPREQWFSVWDVCFPGATRPASPYMDPQLSEQLESFREYFAERGPAIVHSALTERGLLGGASDLGGIHQALFVDAFDEIFRCWMACRRSAQASASQEATPPRDNALRGWVDSTQAELPSDARQAREAMDIREFELANLASDQITLPTQVEPGESHLWLDATALGSPGYPFDEAWLEGLHPDAYDLPG
jgi:hypothetical protein